MSNYKNKQRGKIFDQIEKALTKPSKKVPPVFDYPCECHGIPAKKKPCVIDKATEFKDRNKLEHSLGTFTCSVTRKKCKVSRVKHKAEETLPAVQPNAEMLQDLQELRVS